MAAQADVPATVYTGRIIDTPAFGTLRTRDVHLGVSHTGTITFIAPSSTPLPDILATHGWSARTTKHIALPQPQPAQSQTQTQTQTRFLTPGFVDTHTHAPQYPNTGIFGTTTLLAWLQRYTFPLEASFADLARAKRVYTRAVRRSLAHGTTCAAYYATTHVPATNLLADIAFVAGQRALVGRVCMDRLAPAGYRDETPAAALEATRACVAHCRALDPAGAIVRPVITPRFAPSCSMEVMRALAGVQKDEECWAQTHVSENASELRLVRELFPHARDYVSVYDEAGLLNERCILAHAVHLSDDEVQMIKERKTKISHCPASNTALTSGAFRVKDMQKRGVDVSLGTDMSGGYSPSILEMARQAMSVSRHVAMHEATEEATEQAKLTPIEALFLATLGGAKCVGLQDKVGTFEVGKEFDAQLIRLHHVQEDGELEPGCAPVDAFGWEDWEDLIAKWMYTGDDRNIAQVWVRGRRVHGLEEL